MPVIFFCQETSTGWTNVIFRFYKKIISYSYLGLGRNVLDQCRTEISLRNSDCPRPSLLPSLLPPPPTSLTATRGTFRKVPRLKHRRSLRSLSCSTLKLLRSTCGKSKRDAQVVIKWLCNCHFCARGSIVNSICNMVVISLLQYWGILTLQCGLFLFCIPSYYAKMPFVRFRGGIVQAISRYLHNLWWWTGSLVECKVGKKQQSKSESQASRPTWARLYSHCRFVLTQLVQLAGIYSPPPSSSAEVACSQAICLPSCIRSYRLPSCIRSYRDIINITQNRKNLWAVTKC